MEPNFHDGEYLVVDELSYRFREPERGEVVIFRFPGDPSQFFIKRIVGLPGEMVEVREGQIIVYNREYPDGVVLDESRYLPLELRTGGQQRVGLGENEFFVLGDNRPASSDSRSWGALGEEAIIGRAWVRALPVNRWGVLTFPEPGFINP